MIWIDFLTLEIVLIAFACLYVTVITLLTPTLEKIYNKSKLIIKKLDKNKKLA